MRNIEIGITWNLIVVECFFFFSETSCIEGGDEEVCLLGTGGERDEGSVFTKLLGQEPIKHVSVRREWACRLSSSFFFFIYV